jgi:hypothetical protein
MITLAPWKFEGYPVESLHQWVDGEVKKLKIHKNIHVKKKKY